MSLESDIKYLGNLESFARYLRDVNQQRENAISSLDEANTNEDLHKVRGQILAYSDILNQSNWAQLQVRWREHLSK